MKKLFKSWSISKILFLALILRLIVGLLGFHGDVFDSLGWGKGLFQFGLNDFYFRDTPDAPHPNYPVGFYLILYLNQCFYWLASKVSWWLNLKINLFPSNLVFWLESDAGRIFFNKLPNILADLGLGYLIYLMVKQIKDQKAGLISASFFLFSPPGWYISSLWGQTESLFALPLLFSFYLVFIDQFAWAPILFLISFLIKPTVLLAVPIFGLYWLWKIFQLKEKREKKKELKNRLKKGLWGIGLSLVIFYFCHLPFHPNQTFNWILKLYREDIQEVLGYLTANAFNLWALIFGFETRPDTIPILGISASILGLILFAVFLVYFLIQLGKKLLEKQKSQKEKIKVVLVIASLISFAGFLFLTRMHERYAYLIFLFLVPLTGLDKQLRKIFILFSTIFLINLYHFWWFPRIDLLVNFFSNHLVEKTLIILNFLIFVFLFKTFKMRCVQEKA